MRWNTSASSTEPWRQPMQRRHGGHPTDFRRRGSGSVNDNSELCFLFLSDPQDHWEIKCSATYRPVRETTLYRTRRISNGYSIATCPSMPCNTSFSEPAECGSPT